MWDYIRCTNLQADVTGDAAGWLQLRDVIVSQSLICTADPALQYTSFSAGKLVQKQLRFIGFLKRLKTSKVQMLGS